ncbi:MAG TPA: signal peptidase I [Planctomycetota bacterium]|jgi:signal peptidase I
MADKRNKNEKVKVTLAAVAAAKPEAAPGNPLPPEPPQSDDHVVPKQSFWDSVWGLAFLIVSILLGRHALIEPFKIPSGSMEPTLFGNENFGDRIVTSKLAYADSSRVMLVLAAAAFLVAVGFFASRASQRMKSIAIWTAFTIGLLGGIGWLWGDKAIAGEPKRFDVVVFEYNTAWEGKSARDINYIKRLVGLPGDNLVASGGDLYLHKDGKDQIIRKWKEVPKTQDILWYPISKAWVRHMHECPPESSPSYALVKQQLDNLAFPWNIDGKGATREKQSLTLDGSPATITYKYPVTNIYLKQGRWGFLHENCPESNKEPLVSPEGFKVTNPENKRKDITAFVNNTSEGVQCPNCKQVEFPMVPRPAEGPWMEAHSTERFFYGGENVVGDVRLDLDVDVQTPGSIQVQTGSDLHSALWNIGNAAALPQISGESVHAVGKATPELSAGKHTLSLAYIDGTVIATLDGQTIETREIDVHPPGRAADNIKSIVRVSFAGLKGTVTKLDIYRDLYYTIWPAGGYHFQKDEPPTARHMLPDGSWEAQVPKDHFLMMGDNSPSSSDGRVWGFVPRERIVGRASFVWWPPSRWRLIR